MISLERLLADRLRAVVAAIAALTVLSGLGQLLLPGTVLDLLGAESTATTRHFFAIIGMFMAVVGGVTLQALLVEPTPAFVVLWCAVQKLGAFVAVSVGVLRDLFSSVAMAVALFDLLTAVLATALWRRMRAPAGRHQRAEVAA